MRLDILSRLFGKGSSIPGWVECTAHLKDGPRTGTGSVQIFDSLSQNPACDENVVQNKDSIEKLPSKQTIDIAKFARTINAMRQSLGQYHEPLGAYDRRDTDSCTNNCCGEQLDM
ncbi:hypothetical protein EYC80_006151 [Monilinia laxa]|uniref:Uncharacterized protein n=1 Tax=Monilinia laxa TaxID=61186 RepID=A0A5N6KGA6_MONLA|nr:hypothetical protein EYC80_006151 [Monilinia laxa]